MQEPDPCRKLTLHKPEGTRCIGKPRARWLEPAETDLRKMGIKNWRHKMQDREEWRTILKEAKVRQGLEEEEEKEDKDEEEETQFHPSPADGIRSHSINGFRLCPHLKLVQQAKYHGIFSICTHN
jgi:hypothetical protein